MPQNLQKFAKFQKFQLDNLVDFEKCCKTRIFLQKSAPIQPKTSNMRRRLRFLRGASSMRRRVLLPVPEAAPRRRPAAGRGARLSLRPPRQTSDHRAVGPPGPREALDPWGGCNFWQNFGKFSLVFGCIGAVLCK